MRQVPVLVNVRARGAQPERTAQQIDRALSQLGLTAQVTLSQGREQGEAWARAVAQPDALVLVAGGDGTLSSVLPGLAGSRARLGIVPLGTGNCLARELGLPRSLPQAVQVAVLGQARAIDLGQVNGRHFAVMAGVGFDAQVVAQVGGSLKNLLGPWAYVLQGLALLAQYHPAHLEVELDGERLELLGWLVVLGNAALYAYRWRLAENARIDDGLLDVCLFGARGVGQVVVEMSRVLTGRHLEAPQVCYRRAAEVRITSRPDLCVQADGEPAGATPLMASILPGALKVMVPNRG